MTHDHFYCSTVQFLYHFSPPDRTMTNITLITALISTFSKFKYLFSWMLIFILFFDSCGSSWITVFSFLLFSVSFSACTFRTVSVEVGDDASLQCTNFSTFPSHIFWFKLTDSSNASEVASMNRHNSDVKLYDGFQNGKFNMSSNSITLILTIKGVNSSDSGLYFCGYRVKRYPVIYSATSLMVRLNGKIALHLFYLPIEYHIDVCFTKAVKTIFKNHLFTFRRKT